jgi:hypothetical protein
LIDHPIWQFTDQAICNKIFDQKLIFSKEFLEKIQLIWLVFSQDILNNEIDPFGHIDLKEKVISHKFIDHFVDRVVKLLEFLKFIMPSFEDVAGFS